jgi:hypothetical protein
MQSIANKSKTISFSDNDIEDLFLGGVVPCNFFSIGVPGVVDDKFGRGHELPLFFFEQIYGLGGGDLDASFEKLLQIHDFGIDGEFHLQLLLVVVDRHSNQLLFLPVCLVFHYY